MSSPSGTAPLADPVSGRDALIERWLDRVLGDGPRELSFASDDASFRRYLRVARPAGTRILMDAPPEREDSRPFVRLADELRGLGLRTPVVETIDLASGLLLLEDFGSTTLLDAIDAADPRVDGWLESAIDALAAATHRAARVTDRLDAYDAAAVQRELDLFPVWFIARHLGGPDIRADGCWQAACRSIAAAWQRMPWALVHRDYHSRNLMVLGDGSLGVIDFQDAMAGPVAYDIVSLLKDCYVRWPAATVDALTERYHAAADLPPGYSLAELRRDVELCGIQRHLKVVGIFARLCHRDGKPRYLADLPRVAGYLRDALPAFGSLTPLLDLLPDDSALPAADSCVR